VRARVYAALRRANIPLAKPTNATFYAPGGAAEEQTKLAMHRERRVEALRSVSLFKPLTDKEIESLVDHLRYSPFTKGETATKQGNVAHWLYVLVTGKVEVRIRGEEGLSKDVACIDAPGFFGEMGLMTGEPRQADVIALEDIECYRLDKNAFNHVMQARPEVAAEFSRTLAERRVELWSVKEGLSEDEKAARKKSEEERIFVRIKEFFALDERASRVP
jgi:CRP-like cAMP-binding protein